MRLLLTLAVLAVLPQRVRATLLCQEARLALADAKKLPKGEAQHWRYVTLYNLVGKEELELHEKVVLLFMLNSLSLEPDLARPVKVGPTLYRVNILYYGERFAKAWEALGAANPYFPCFERVTVQATLKVEVVEEVEKEPFVDIYNDEGDRGLVKISRAQAQPGRSVYVRDVVGGTLRKLPELPPLKKIQKRVEVKVPQEAKVQAFVPLQEVQDLADLTGSKAPIVRADWLFYRVSRSEDRQGDGYYDFLGIKSRADALELAGVDLKQIARLRMDLAAMISESGVATNKHRQVWWVAGYGRISWWQTFDIDKDPKGKRNLLRLAGTALDKVDFDHQAEEVYWHLPNRLWAVGAWDDKGVIQKFVPQQIAAADKTAKSQDTRIHVGYNCFDCHSKGLREIDDWAKDVYQAVEDRKQFGQAALKNYDPKQELRFKQLYFGDMPRQLKRDQDEYAERLKELNGLTPEVNSAGVRLVKERYFDTPLDMDAFAADLGVKPEVWKKALTNHATRVTAAGGIVDPIFVGLLAKKARKVIRSDVEEIFAVSQALLKEAGPP